MTQTINNPIAQLNDQLRRTFLGGTVLSTIGVQSLPVAIQQEVIQAVQSFDNFDEDNDPYCEHDFGSFICQEVHIYFKIDCVPQKRKEEIHMN